MRRLLVCLFLLACAAPAQAAPRPVAKAPHSFALAGDAILVSRVSDRTLTVEAVPGGQVFRYEAPEGSVPSGRLAASPQRAAMTITLEDDECDIAAVQVVPGPGRGRHRPACWWPPSRSRSPERPPPVRARAAS